MLIIRKEGKGILLDHNHHLPGIGPHAREYIILYTTLLGVPVETGQKPTLLGAKTNGSYPKPASLARMMAWERSATCSLLKMLEI